ncbi:hypothetical protein JYU34_018410 [Plutella xylostella]|uniref:RAP domain-containing protein n=1 Tax=Plutella xylostella TaxID=51655 RepID=A0ABQ7PXM4_PLUXY|nr:hypothetical protein JYU34_018410 [Plutella xylostella]
MSQLLQGAWRSVLRSTSVSVRSLSAGIDLSQPPKPTDAVMTTLKTAPSPAVVLAAVQRHLPALDQTHMLQALRTLFELSRHSRSKESIDSLTKDPAFSTLCQNFRKHARSLDVNEAIEASKVLIFLQLPVDSLILQTLLQIIRCNINYINLRQVIFLDFLLSRLDSKNHLVDALKLALPLVFQIHLPLELDHEDLPLLKDMLAYCTRHDLPDRCINNIVTGLLLHDQTIDAKTAKLIVWSLCEVNCTEERFPTRVQLLHICYDILAQSIDQLTYDEVLKTAAKIKGRILEKHSEYYHAGVMDAFASYVVSHDVEFEKGMLIARILSRLAHTNLTLLEYLCTTAAINPTCLARAQPNILFGFINCLSNSNYTPEPSIWTELRDQISKNPVLDGKNPALPWTKFCLEMASLGLYEDRLLKRVLSQEFLDEYLGRENNQLDYLQLLMLHEAVKAFHDKSYTLPAPILQAARSRYPLHPLTAQLAAALAAALGPSSVASCVALPSGVVADVVTCLKAGRPVELPQNLEDRTPIEKLNLPEDSLIVCIMNFNQGCYSVNSRRLRGSFRLVLDILEKQGYAAIGLNVNDWLAAPEHERTPYLLREVSYKCGERGVKLCAT